MHNRKLKGSIAVLALSAVLVGGTFAWLGSTDDVTNVFKTTKYTEPMDGVDIWEKFEQNSEVKATLDTTDNKMKYNTIEKIVQVKNTAKYNSLIRVEMNAAFEDSELALDDSKIILNESEFVKSEDDIKVDTAGNITNMDAIRGKWIKVQQNVTENEKPVAKTYYYYIGNVLPEGFTDKILNSVTLDNSVASNPNYINQTFNVDIDAYSVQSTAEAVTSSDDGIDKFGATGEQKGFGLNEQTEDGKLVHEKLVKALQAVANEDASTCTTNYNTLATPETSTTN